jgi:hypothetical protein
VLLHNISGEPLDNPTSQEKAAESSPALNDQARIFRYTEVPVVSGPTAVRFDTHAKLEAGRFELQGVMVRLPLKLRRRIENQTRGALSVTLCALAEYALDRLEAENKGIKATVETETRIK